MKNLFKSKFILSLLASSFVLATGLVSMSNVNSSFAMQKLDYSVLEQAYENYSGQYFECSGLKHKDITARKKPYGDEFYEKGDIYPFNIRYKDGSWAHDELKKDINYDTGGNGFKCKFVSYGEMQFNAMKQYAYEGATGKYFAASDLSFKDISVVARENPNRLKFYIKDKETGKYELLNVLYNSDGNFRYDKPNGKERIFRPI